MADISGLLFVVALILTFFHPRISATIALVAALLCLPIYLYFIMPGLYQHIFGGESSVPLQTFYYWNSWSAVGILSLVFVTFSSLRSYSKTRIGRA
jgi:hypothetical protein